MRWEAATSSAIAIPNRRPGWRALLGTASGLLAACGSDPAPTGPIQCNGSQALCDRRVDEVAIAFAHNAMSSAEDGWYVPNQDYGLERQLADGIRGFMLDTHTWDDAHPGVWLCHGFCELGATPAVDGFRVLADFLADNPGEVIALDLESGVSPVETEAALQASGLLAFARVQAVGEPWPTLGELVDEGDRALVFTESDGGTYPWYLDAYSFAWDTNYSATTPDELTCDVLRGSADNAIFLMNNFLTAPVARVDLAEQVNPESFLWPRVQACEAETGDTVNWIAVDFYDVGDVLEVVDRLNDR